MLHCRPSELSKWIFFFYRFQDFCKWPDEPFEQMDSTLAVQQYIQQQIRKDPGNVDCILTPPDSQDEGVWKYEHLRQFCMELNGLAVSNYLIIVIPIRE